MSTASWKVTESREASVITQKSERSYLSSVMRRTEENGRKVVSLDTSEAETVSYEELVYCTREIKSSGHCSLICPLEIRSRHEGNMKGVSRGR